MHSKVSVLEKKLTHSKVSAHEKIGVQRVRAHKKILTHSRVTS